MKLLHLDSSIQGDSSATRQISAAVVERLKTIHPGLEVDYRDLAGAPLPHITLGGFATEEAAAVIDQFLAADIVVIGVPMYNFGLPTQLKAWFDHILVAGRTFRYDANGVEGLAGDKRTILVLSRGGIYSEGSPGAGIEHAESHLRAMIGFIGVTNIETILTEGIALGPEQRDAAIGEALSRVEAIDADRLPAAA